MPPRAPNDETDAGDGASSLTVADVLALPSLRHGLPAVLAGEDALDRPVRWVHAGEVEHMASQLRGGEVLLTTGMGVGARVPGQRAYVRRLAERGLAALVVELGTSHAELPGAVVAEARARGLPLVVLHREVPFVAVTEEVHGRIVNARYALLRRGDELQRRLTRALLDGGGVPDVLRLTAGAIGNPVVLEDGDGALLAHAAGADDDADVLDAFAAAGGASGGPAGWGSDVRAGASVEVSMPTGQAPGRLVVLALSGPLDALTHVALERAAGVVALSLLRVRQEAELVERERRDLLDALAGGRVPDERAAGQAAALGFRPGGLLVPLAADGPATSSPAAWAQVLRDVQREIDAGVVSALVGARARVGRLLALVAVPDRESRADRADRLAAVVRAAAARRLEGAEIQVVAGDAVPWPAVGAELRRTAEAAASAVGLPAADRRDVHDLELQRLLWHWREDDDLAAFVARRLGPLVEHDRRRKHRLLPTLEALVAHGGHKAEAARALHLNRQALYSRLRRIEDLLGVDLDDPERTLELHLALRARWHLGAAGERALS